MHPNVSGLKVEILKNLIGAYQQNNWEISPAMRAAALNFFQRVQDGVPVELKISGVAGGGKTAFLRRLMHIGVQCVAYSLGRCGRYIRLVRDGRTGDPEPAHLPPRVTTVKFTDFLWRLGGAGPYRTAPDDQTLVRAALRVIPGRLGSPWLEFLLLSEIHKWRRLFFNAHGNPSEHWIHETATRRGLDAEKKTIYNALTECHNEIKRDFNACDEAGFLSKYIQGEVNLGEYGEYVLVSDDTEDMTPLETGAVRRLRQRCYVVRTLDPQQNRLWITAPDDDIGDAHRLVADFAVSHRLPAAVARHLNFYAETLQTPETSHEGAIYKCSRNAMLAKCRPGDLIAVRTLDDLVRLAGELTDAGKPLCGLGRNFETWTTYLVKCVQAVHPKTTLRRAVEKLREELSDARWAALRPRETIVQRGLLDGWLRLMRRLNDDNPDRLRLFWHDWAFGAYAQTATDAVNIAFDVDCKHLETDNVWYLNQHEIPGLENTWSEYLGRLHYLVASRTRRRFMMAADEQETSNAT